MKRKLLIEKKKIPYISFSDSEIKEGDIVKYKPSGDLFFVERIEDNDNTRRHGFKNGRYSLKELFEKHRISTNKSTLLKINILKQHCNV